MNKTENSAERKTLSNAYQRLQIIANHLNEIEDLIEILNQKLDGTENDPRPTGEKPNDNLLKALAKVSGKGDFMIQEYYNKTFNTKKK
jgi:hypothetical protein